MQHFPEWVRGVRSISNNKGRVDEAITILRIRADAGDRHAAGRLADLLAEQGRVNELRTRAEAGDEDAAYWLADHFEEQEPEG
jgi:hypothetical protein